MKNQKRTNSKISFLGVILFFSLVAIIVQVAILTYDFIASKTDDTFLIAILVLILVLILALIVTIFDVVRRKLTVDKPVDKILNATEEIARGNFDVEIPIEHPYKKYNSYDVIMENINKMTAELKKSEVLKSDFISNVSHELKTPLAIIQSYATLLEGDDIDEETRKKYAKTLQDASKRLSELITNILKMTKLENQEIIEKKESINLTESLSEAIIAFEELIEKKGLTLECDLDDVTIISVPSYLEIIWNNLLSNAIKFTEPGGKITVLLKKMEEYVTVSISDTGCGISKENGERIFEKFYQGDTSHASEGNGLGLALVKKIIDILGGEISVESELGKGSTFKITLKEAIEQ